jgi:hypothetical protein
MNLDQVDVVNDPNLTGKPMEELTEYCEHKSTLIVLLPEYLVSISSISHWVAEALRTHVGSVFWHHTAYVSGSLRF